MRWGTTLKKHGRTRHPPRKRLWDAGRINSVRKTQTERGAVLDRPGPRPHFSAVRRSAVQRQTCVLTSPAAPGRGHLQRWYDEASSEPSVTGAHVSSSA